MEQHVKIARNLWHIAIRKKGTDAGKWARYSAQVHMQLARVARNNAA